MNAGFKILCDLLVAGYRHVRFIAEYLSMNDGWVRGVLAAETLLLPGDIPEPADVAGWARELGLRVDQRHQSAGLIVDGDDAVVFVEFCGLVGVAKLGCGCEGSKEVSR